MNRAIFKQTFLFGSTLLLVLGLVFFVNPAHSAAISQNARNFCQDQSSALQGPCEHGYDAENNGTDVGAACHAYINAALSACQTGFGYAHEDPAVKCNPNQCDFVAKYINPAINLFSLSFGLIATISIILGGMQYSASAGDPQKAAAAKSRISNTIIALFAYLFLYAFLQFLIPGGAFQ